MLIKFGNRRFMLAAQAIRIVFTVCRFAQLAGSSQMQQSFGIFAKMLVGGADGHAKLRFHQGALGKLTFDTICRQIKDLSQSQIAIRTGVGTGLSQ